MPLAAGRFTLIVSVDAPEAITGFGPKLALVFAGSPEMLSVTELLFPTAATRTVRLPLDPRVTVSDELDRESVKFPAGATTVTVNVALWVRLLLPPSAPVTVTW